MSNSATSDLKSLYDVVVVGGGHNGLVNSAYLAGAGLSVALVEQNERVGGLCQTAEVLPGLRGNLAANSAHNLDPVVAAELDLSAHGLSWIEIQPISSMALLPDASRILAHKDPSLRDAEFDQFGVGEADAYRGLLEELNELGRALNVSFYDPPPGFDELQSRVPTGRMQELFNAVMFGSMSDLAVSHLVSDQVRASLAMLAVAGNYVGVRTPGSAYQLLQRPLYRGASVADQRNSVMATAEYSSFTPRGGMGAVTRAIASAARTRGVDIVTGAAVDGIELHNGRATGVRLGDRHVRARIVVSALNPVHTLLSLVPRDALDPEFRSGLESTPMEGCLGKVYLGLDGLPRFAAARTQEENRLMTRCGFRAGPKMGALEESYQLSRGGSFRGEPVVYGLVQTAFDDSLNPAGLHLMSLSVSYVPRRLNGTNWDTEKAEWIRHIVHWLTQHIPNLPEILVSADGLTTEDLENKFALAGGNALHGDVVGQGMFDSRPFIGHTDYTSPVAGLYMCSNGTWPGNYVSGLPGRNAALKVLRDIRAGVLTG